MLAHLPPSPSLPWHCGQILQLSTIYCCLRADRRSAALLLIFSLKISIFSERDTRGAHFWKKILNQTSVPLNPTTPKKKKIKIKISKDMQYRRVRSNGVFVAAKLKHSFVIFRQESSRWHNPFKCIIYDCVYAHDSDSENSNEDIHLSVFKRQHLVLCLSEWHQS